MARRDTHKLAMNPAKTDVIGKQDHRLSRPYARKANVPFDQERKERFLACLEEHGNVALASAESGVTSTTAYNHRKADPGFEEAWDEARGRYLGRLEAEATRRARDGMEQGIYYKGERVAGERVYSDRLMELLLKKNDPEYRESSGVHVHAGGEAGVLVVGEIPATEGEWVLRHGGAVDAAFEVVPEPEEKNAPGEE